MTQTLEELPRLYYTSCRGFLYSSPQRDIVFGGVHVIPIDKSVYWRVVQFIVQNGPAPVLDGVFDRSDG